MSVVFAAIPALMYLLAGLPVAAGAMTIGSLVAFTTLQGQLFRPLMQLLDVQVSVTSSMALFSRVFEYQDLPVDITDPAPPVALDPAVVRGEIRWEGVSFTYPDADRAALSGVDLSVSALDNETERTVRAALDEASRGRTTITIAHRLSTIRDADSIAVLHRGRVVEQGAHEELLARGGRYAALVGAAERAMSLAA